MGTTELENINKLINLENLLNLNCNGLYCLINEQDRKVDVRYSCNLLRAVASLVESISDNSVVPLEISKDASKLQLVVLEKNIEGLKLKHAFWQQYYKNLGYSLYRTKPGNKYVVEVSVDYVRELHQSHHYFVVRLKSKGSTVTVGIFDQIEDLQDFVSEYYSGVVVEIIFANNNLTSSYVARIPVDS